jgi:hypothetical protein
MSPVLSKAARYFETDEGWIKSNDGRRMVSKFTALELGSRQDDKSIKLVDLPKMCLH